MIEHTTVPVCSSRVHDLMPGSTAMSKFKASRELTRHQFKGRALEGAGEDVRIAEPHAGAAVQAPTSKCTVRTSLIWRTGS
jgi:hypothetical protein